MAKFPTYSSNILHFVVINIMNSLFRSQKSSNFSELKMASLKLSFLVTSCLIFILIQSKKVQSGLASNDGFGIKDWFDKLTGKAVNPVTKALCGLKTVHKKSNRI